MNLNSKGEACWGSAAGVGVGTSVITRRPASSARWLNDSEICTQIESTPGGPWHVEAIHKLTGASRVLLDKPANFVLAGGEVFASWPERIIHGAGGEQGLFWGRLGDVSPVGITAAVGGQEDSGEGIWIYGPSALLIRQTNTLPVLDDATGGQRDVRIRGKYILWLDTGGMHIQEVLTAGDLPFVKRVEHVNFAIPIPMDNGDLWLYERTDRHTLRHAGDSMGYEIPAPPGTTYAPDAKRVGDRIVVSWSSTPGESAASFQTYEFFPSATTLPRINLNVPIIPKVDLGKFSHPIFITPWKSWNDRDDYGRTVPPTNGLVTDTIDAANVPGKPWFLGDQPDWDSVPTSQLIGYVTTLEGGGSNPDVLDGFEKLLPRFKAGAIRRKVPLYCCYDGDWTTSGDFIAKYCKREMGLEIVPMVELYPRLINGWQQSVDANVSAWTAQIEWLLAQKRFKRLAFSTSIYTQWRTGPDNENFPLALIVALQPRMADLVRIYKPILVAPFSVGRPSGVLSYKDTLWPILEQWGAAGPKDQVPKILDLTGPGTGDPVATGTVTISKWSPGSGPAPLAVHMEAEITGDVKFLQWRYRRDGTLSPWLQSALNPASDLTHTITLPEGSYELNLRGLDASQNPIPGAETGARRVVSVFPGVPVPMTDVAQLIANIETNLAALKAAVLR